MTQQYNNIAVFKAKPSNNERAPSFNVQIEFADGSKWRGGLWEKTSKAGTKYLSGSLEPDTGEYTPRQAPKAQPKQAAIDW